MRHPSPTKRLASQNAAPSGGLVGNLVTVTDQDFEAVVLNSGAPVLVFFTAPWSGPARTLERVLEQISGERDDVRIVRYNWDENEDWAGAFGVQGIPIMILFRDREQILRVVGARGKEQLTAEIDRALSSQQD